jgi:hypothetical protein
MALEGTFAQLEALGLFDVILPFILIFTVVFAILQKVKLFGDNSKNFNVVIALVMGLAVVFPHVLGYYAPQNDIVLIINHALPNVSVVIIAILMALLIIGVMGKKWSIGTNSLSGWLAIAAFAVVIYIFGSAAGWWMMPWWLDILNNPDIMSLVVVILVFAIIIWLVTKDGGEQKKSGPSIAEQMGALMGGGEGK